jgi:hypothetical protein
LRLLILYTESRGKDLLGGLGKIEKSWIAAFEETESDQQPDTLETGFGFLGAIIPKTPGKIRRGFRALSLQQLENQKIALCQLHRPDFGKSAVESMVLSFNRVFKSYDGALRRNCFRWYVRHVKFRSFRIAQ